MTTRTESVSLNEKRALQKISFNGIQIVIAILGFFISRASIINGMTPFGISFLTASLGRSFSIAALISSILGLLSFHGFNSYSYLISSGIIFTLFALYTKEKEISIFKTSLFSSFIFVGVNIFKTIILKNFYIYDFLMIFFEGLVIFTLSYIFSYGLPKETVRKTKFTNEEVICVFITLSLAISGLTDFEIFSLSFKNLLSIFFVMTSGYIYGAALGAGMGISVGMISYLSQSDMPFLLAIFGLGGLLSGVFRDLGKFGTILGFVLANSIMSFYINGYSTSFLSYYELAIACGLFYIFSNYMKENFLFIPLSVSSLDNNDIYSERTKELTTKKLKYISEVFKDLGGIFKKVSYNEEVYTDNITKFINCVANDVCKNCSMNVFCWKDDFYTTYCSIFDLIASMEMTGGIDEENLPELFKNTCINTEEILDKTHRLFDLYKVNYTWEKRMAENRKLVAEQLSGISNIMEGLMKDIDKSPVFKEDVEMQIYSSLKSQRVNIKNVMVAEYSEEDFEIYLEVGKCFKGENSLENVRDIVSEVVGIPLKGDFTVDTMKAREVNRYKLIKANRYGAITRIAKNSESFNVVSGDSYTFGEEGNNYFAALSDGMGIGRRANFESTIAISLLEKFLEAGFDKEIALKTINSILMLKSEEEIFTTLDISTIDLYSGKLQTIKTGAAPTFIKKKDRVLVIDSNSLPVGMLKDVDLEIYEEYLDDGDFIIMMSDGVLESNEDANNKEKWIIDIIANIDSFNPQTVANMLMKEAKKACHDEIKDDMTVLVTKVWKIK
ncbi:stage II sporulation protein E [Sporanaerobacter acetigenes]|uniref:Stage II sporulation protein E n=1 Tax=Sporanaerobacter acetigenes DSM 13106 TaxID=1123281 RepID=A0A1M5Y6C0_9FIRM|nr:stage II sporulation protein E [Sporanaerobacter acetigenes]SHI07469.1 stage II sporulation protein E [Sporanaerobacter acetigenes DSM 13106]